MGSGRSLGPENNPEWVGGRQLSGGQAGQTGLPTTDRTVLREGAEISSDQWFVPKRLFGGDTAARKSPASKILLEHRVCLTRLDLECVQLNTTSEGKHRSTQDVSNPRVPDAPTPGGRSTWACLK